MNGPIDYSREWHKGAVYGPDGRVRRQVLLYEEDGLGLCLFDAHPDVVDIVFGWREKAARLAALEAAAKVALEHLVEINGDYPEGACTRCVDVVVPALRKAIAEVGG